MVLMLSNCLFLAVRFNLSGFCLCAEFHVMNGKPA